LQIRAEPSKIKNIVSKICAIDYVLELYQVMGEHNLLTKLVVPNLAAAEKCIQQIGLIDGIIDCKTLIITTEVKNCKSLPSTTLQKSL